MRIWLGRPTQVQRVNPQFCRVVNLHNYGFRWPPPPLVAQTFLVVMNLHLPCTWACPYRTRPGLREDPKMQRYFQNWRFVDHSIQFSFNYHLTHPHCAYIKEFDCQKLRKEKKSNSTQTRGSLESNVPPIMAKSKGWISQIKTVFAVKITEDYNLLSVI